MEDLRKHSLQSNTTSMIVSVWRKNSLPEAIKTIRCPCDHSDQGIAITGVSGAPLVICTPAELSNRSLTPWVKHRKQIIKGECVFTAGMRSTNSRFKRNTGICYFLRHTAKWWDSHCRILLRFYVELDKCFLEGGRKMNQRLLNSQTLPSAPEVPEQQFASVLWDSILVTCPSSSQSICCWPLSDGITRFLWLYLHTLCPFLPVSAALPWGCALRAQDGGKVRR